MNFILFNFCLLDSIVSYPKIEFYHTDGIRTMMVDILFIYAKLKPYISYRQVCRQQSSLKKQNLCIFFTISSFHYDESCLIFNIFFIYMNFFPCYEFCKYLSCFVRLFLLKISVLPFHFSFPDVEYFNDSKIHTMMVNILFIFARLYPNISYKQVRRIIFSVHSLLHRIYFQLFSKFFKNLISQNFYLVKESIEIIFPIWQISKLLCMRGLIAWKNSSLIIMNIWYT